MAHPLGDSRSNGDLSTTATKRSGPPKKAASLGARIAAIAVLVGLFAVIGVIAQLASGDLKFSLRDVSESFEQRRFAPQKMREDATKPMRKGDGPQASAPSHEERWSKTASEPRTTYAERTYAEKTASEPRDYKSPWKTSTPDKGFDRGNKKDDFFTPKEEPRKDPLPGKKDKDPGFPTKTEVEEKKPVVVEQEPIDSNRKIIRTGEMDFEIDSYKVAVNTITRLIVQIKGAFIADSKNAQLKSGKVQGYVVVRMPPQFLDQFILDLDRDLGKIGELKMQRINSQDVTKQFTDTESSLKAARTMEDRLLNIIKTGKGEIKDLIVAENALGEWRTKIEKMEGELRYYANQVSLSTLTISLAERETQAQFALIAAENVTMRIEVEDVKQAHRNAEKAVFDAKGRIVRSEVKQHAAGQLEAVLHAEVPPSAKDSFGAIVRKLGIVSQDESHFQQETRGGVGKPMEIVKPKEQDARFELSFYNLANVKPRKSTTVRLAAANVPAAYQKLHEAIAKAKGQVRNTNLDETDKRNMSASIDFTVLTADKKALDDALEEVGPLLTRQNVQAPISELSSERKFGYYVTLVSTASIQPRESTTLRIASTNVPVAFEKLHEAIAKVKGHVRNTNLDESDKLNITATIDFTVATEDKKTLNDALKDVGSVLARQNLQMQVTDFSSEGKFGYHVTLISAVNIQPREKTQLRLEVRDVDESATKLKERAASVQARLVDSRTHIRPNGETSATFEFDVSLKSKDALVRQFKEVGIKLIGQEEERFPTAPDNDLAIARIKVEIAGTNPIVPSDEGFGSYLRTGFYRSFQILATSLMLILIGASVIVPWAVLIWGGYKLYCRLNPTQTLPLEGPASPSAPVQGEKVEVV